MAEAKQWAPSRWSPDKIRVFTNNVYIHMEGELYVWWGGYEGALLAAEINNARKAADSKTRLEAAGVATLGQS